MRARRRIIAFSGLALVLGLFAVPGNAASPQPLGFGSYGEARIGDTAAQVRAKVPGVEPCHLLAGRCVCASVEVGQRAVTFVYALDLRSSLDLIFTNSTAVPGPRGIRVGDSVRELRRLFPNAHPIRPIHIGSRYFVVNHGRLGMLVLVRDGRIFQITTGKNRFFHYEEYCS
jgi:hypothetical protein